MTDIAIQATKPEISNIYRLADHLDATFAMGEDLLLQALTVAPLTAGDATQAIATRHQQISTFARDVRALELGMTARILQARNRAIDVRDVHPRFQPLIRLFIGGTAPLADAAAQNNLGDVSELALASGSDVLMFLKSRALSDASSSSLAGVSHLQITENYLLAASIHLGTLMDMIAQFLGSLDLAFDLYAEPRATV